MLFSICSAPTWQWLYLDRAESIQPYEKIWEAVCLIESSNNPLAIGDKNLKEHSYGIAQIRRERLEDYNKSTGHKYLLYDLFDPGLSKAIFMHYAFKYGPYRIDEAVMRWNGSGPATLTYWNNVKLALR